MTEEQHDIRLRVNGIQHTARVPARRLLSDCLRHDLGLTGTHVGCEHGVCGACTVLLDGQPVRSCLVLAVSAAQHDDITTVEGLAAPDGTPHPVQQAFGECHALQCGFCTPGFLTLIAAYVRDHPDPGEDDAREAVTGNLCRCTGYQNIVNAVLRTAEITREQDGAEVGRGLGHAQRPGGLGGAGGQRGGHAQRLHLGGAQGCAAHGVQRDVEAQPEVPFARAVEVVLAPVEQDGEVGGLLDLQDEGAGSQGVRHARGHQDGVAAPQRELVHPRQQAAGVLALDQVGELGSAYRHGESEVDGGVVVRVEHDPGFGLAVAAGEVAAGEVAVGVQVDGQALAGVQQLGQQLGLRSEALQVLRSQPGAGVGGDGVAQQRAVG
ncbi:(2Fe-2S)-binding protein, partial [Streptomonospora algeriensis]